ncbi:unnamed protein product [Ceutorhynchus assimilis]|uniref:CCHC-type domain-containing protein n=1 Tax=Ceutorhynchus assimilis TaxID=467358 RepID=A0A9N9QI84_9CUCU|nr:unnamed protein product [Ceutorhynchus assimilis]
MRQGSVIDSENDSVHEDSFSEVSDDDSPSKVPNVKLPVTSDTLQEDCFAIVKFLYNEGTKKETTKEFVAQIEKVAKSYIAVNCLRSYKGHKDSFVFPEVEDKSKIKLQQVRSILSAPRIHRGVHVFEAPSVADLEDAGPSGLIKESFISSSPATVTDSTLCSPSTVAHIFAKAIRQKRSMTSEIQVVKKPTPRLKQLRYGEVVTTEEVAARFREAENRKIKRPKIVQTSRTSETNLAGKKLKKKSESSSDDDDIISLHDESDDSKFVNSDEDSTFMGSEERNLDIAQENKEAEVESYDNSDETEMDMPLAELRKKIEIKVGDFVIVKFIYNLGTKKEIGKNFVAEIVELDNITAKFLRKFSKETATYIFPLVEDKQVIIFDQILAIDCEDGTSINLDKVCSEKDHGGVLEANNESVYSIKLNNDVLMLQTSNAQELPSAEEPHCNFVNSGVETYTLKVERASEPTEGLQTCGIYEQMKACPHPFKDVFCNDKIIETSEVLGKIFDIEYNEAGSNRRQIENRVISYFRDYILDCEELPEVLMIDEEAEVEEVEEAEQLEQLGAEPEPEEVEQLEQPGGCKGRSRFLCPRSLKIDIPQDYLVDAIITGINNEDVVRAARSSKFSDTNELYAYLSTLNNLPQNFTRLERKQFVYQPSTSAADAKNSVNSNNKVSKGVICFNCQGQHYFKNCPKPKLECFHCKKLGHKQNQCPLKSTKNSFKNSVHAVDKTGEPNPYIMPVNLNGIKFKCLVDTSSTRTLLKRSVIEKLGLRIENNDIGKLVLRGFSGNLVVSEGTVAVRIRMDNACAELEVIVLDDEQMMHDFIYLIPPFSKVVGVNHDAGWPNVKQLC